MAQRAAAARVTARPATVPRMAGMTRALGLPAVGQRALTEMRAMAGVTRGPGGEGNVGPMRGSKRTAETGLPARPAGQLGAVPDQQSSVE
jgi:hypothetical protein